MPETTTAPARNPDVTVLADTVQPMNRHQRRTLEARLKTPAARRAAYQRIPAWGKLAMTALALAEPLLRRAGHRLSPAREGALMWLLGNVSKQALRVNVGRLAYDLEAGLGKTTAVACTIAAAHRLKLPCTFAVAVSRLDQLFDLRLMLLNDLNVPADLVGIWHAESKDTGQRLDSQGNTKWVASDENATQRPWSRRSENR